MRRIVWLWAVLVFAGFATHATCEARKARAANVDVLMLSDIHFDPFRDPTKFARLAAADAAEWPRILNEHDGTGAVAAYAKLEVACPVHGEDSSWELLRNSLRAAQARLPHPGFVTVSGDLMVHEFPCRYKAVGGDAALYATFAAKTVAAVAAQVHEAFAPAPVYLALGNNDSGCGDYREDPNSGFLKADAAAFAADADPRNRATVQATYSALGDATVTLPLRSETRLIVLQDMFQSVHYKSCGEKTDTAPAEMQIAWLRAQLEQARAAHANVWLMGHVPPGIDLYATTSARKDVCSGAAPLLYQRTDAFSLLLREYADVVRLAIFAHSHMDELRVYRAADGKAVPGKLVASISPVNKNEPSFTVAEVSSETAVMEDYAVYVSSNPQGAGEWKQGYDFRQMYGEPDFSGASVAKLIDGFVKDADGSAAHSQAYRWHFWPGDSGVHAIGFGMVWKSFACATAEPTADEYRHCLCGDTAAK